MARKNLLKGLLEEAAKPEGSGKKPAEPAKTAAPSPAPAPRRSKGAIGAVSQSIAELKSRAIEELDPETIEPGGVKDRLEYEDADHAALVASIREYGQQVPVLVRPHSDKPGVYQIVYGRRRVMALRDLGLPVKAMIRDLDDRDLLLAQGQENAARRDLSFIEKANFARQMDAAGYDRKTICAALHVDKTVISRMLSVTSEVPIDVIESIGSAPSIGRERWLALAEALKNYDGDLDAARALAGFEETDSSDGRFEALLKRLKKPSKAAETGRAAETVAIIGDKGVPLGKLTHGADKTTFVFKSKATDGFDRWLAQNMSEIHRDWKNRSGG